MRPDHRWQDIVRVLNAKRDRSNGPPLPLWCHTDVIDETAIYVESIGYKND